jgi:hypothetical protein
MNTSKKATILVCATTLIDCISTGELDDDEYLYVSDALNSLQAALAEFEYREVRNKIREVSHHAPATPASPPSAFSTFIDTLFGEQ